MLTTTRNSTITSSSWPPTGFVFCTLALTGSGVVVALWIPTAFDYKVRGM